LELLQAYFLIHDDWMDRDSTRRGGPTAHVELARLFRSKELGDKSAILAGDHAVALASAHLSRLPVSPARLRRCLDRFAEMQLDAVFGQQLDLLGAAEHPEITYELKTASYTVSGPLLMGAEIAGARPALTKVLANYATPAGVAFQLRDDLVGVFGSSQVTGKPQGGDLKEGKNTSLVLEGRNRLRGSERRNLERVLGNRKATAAQVKAVVRSLEDCGARIAVEGRISELMVEANSHLRAPVVSTRGRRLLLGAAVAHTERAT
jgi:geranylgeranyl diphosphate synthase type I